MSYILLNDDRKGQEAPRGEGVYLDSSYQRVGTLTHNIGTIFNAHEFDLRENGTKALFIATEDPHRADVYSHKKGWFHDDCIREVDLTTNHTDFYWCPLDHGVTLNESYHKLPNFADLSAKNAWDYL